VRSMVISTVQSVALSPGRGIATAKPRLSQQAVALCSALCGGRRGHGRDDCAFFATGTGTADSGAVYVENRAGYALPSGPNLVAKARSPMATPFMLGTS